MPGNRRSSKDCDSLRRFSPFVAGPTAGAGDPAQDTAEGVFYGMRAAIVWRLKRHTLEGVHAAVQGVGSVGWRPCRLLRDAHAQLLVAITNEKPAAGFYDGGIGLSHYLEATAMIWLTR
jgi:leucine dehydrogenase